LALAGIYEEGPRTYGQKTQTVEPTVSKTLTVATRRLRWRPLTGLAAAIVVMSVVVLSGQELKHVPPASPSFMVLHSFDGTDGANPLASLTRDAAGNLYGTAGNGGALGNGVVFKLSPAGTETVLYSFTGGADGGGPGGGLIRDTAANLYGTTFSGGDDCEGSSGCGVVFKLGPSGTETVLYSFNGGDDGANPLAGLVRDATGNLYGTAVHGG
jgi:uncharacterized repeat protein (TIGR03803 family)